MDEIIKKYEFKEGLNLEFEILDLKEVLSVKKPMMIIPHRAQFYHILWIEKGEGTHFVDFNPISLQDHSIICVPQNSVNRYDKRAKYKGKAIVFTDRFFSKTKQDFQYLQSSILFSDLYPVSQFKINPKSSDLKIVLNLMEQEFNKKKDVAHYHILHNLLHVFLLQLEREMKDQGFEEIKPSANLDYLMLFKDLLEQNFRNEKSVNKYAADLSISEKQLNKACTTLLDKKPKQIINDRILLEAKRLLVHSNQSIKEIAYHLGYEEPTNFIKYFRKNTDITPSEFRER